MHGESWHATAEAPHFRCLPIHTSGKNESDQQRQDNGAFAAADHCLRLENQNEALESAARSLKKSNHNRSTIHLGHFAETDSSSELADVGDWRQLHRNIVARYV